MAPRVFFSFDYDDVISFRANVVRNHKLLKDTGTAGFFDASIWGNAKLTGDGAVMKLIDSGLQNTTVTCVLIGSKTWQSKWVRYEILKSYDRGNKLLGVHINGIKDKDLKTYTLGPNPFTFLGFHVNTGGILTYFEKSNDQWVQYGKLSSKNANVLEKYWNKGYALSQWVPCYDWVTQDGYQNFASWVENAK